MPKTTTRDACDACEKNVKSRFFDKTILEFNGIIAQSLQSKGIDKHK